MTIIYSKERGHLLCSWEKDKKVRFMGKDIEMRRTVTKRIPVTPHGTIHTCHLNKLETVCQRQAVLKKLHTLKESGQLYS